MADLAHTDYVDYHWVAGVDLDKRYGDGFTDRLQQALIDQTGHRTPPQSSTFCAEAFIPAADGDYAAIEAVGRELGNPLMPVLELLQAGLAGRLQPTSLQLQVNGSFSWAAVVPAST